MVRYYKDFFKELEEYKKQPKSATICNSGNISFVLASKTDYLGSSTMPLITLDAEDLAYLEKKYKPLQIAQLQAEIKKLESQL